MSTVETGKLEFKQPKIRISLELDIPQEFEGYEKLISTLGIFVFSFVKLERTLTWSYVIASSNGSVNTTESILECAARFDGLNKNSSDRISKWFKTLRNADEKNLFVKDLNILKDFLVTTNDTRNRLVHDPAGSFRQSFDGVDWSEPEYHFVQQFKDGNTKSLSFRPNDIMRLVDQTVELQSEVRRITQALFPDAPNILI